MLTLNQKYELLYGNRETPRKKVFGALRKNHDHKVDLVRKLFDEGKSLTEVSEIADIPMGSMKAFMYKWDIKARTDGRNSGNRGPGKRNGKNHWSHGKLKLRGKWVPENEVREILAEFREQDLTIAEMAKECGVDPKTITNQLSRFGLQGGLRSGERTPQWKGGHSKYRGPGWLTIREQILERDGYSCIMCGKTQDEARADGHGLSVHHIIPFCETQDNSPENLESLCQSCHMIEEQNLN